MFKKTKALIKFLYQQHNHLFYLGLIFIVISIILTKSFLIAFLIVSFLLFFQLFQLFQATYTFMHKGNKIPSAHGFWGTFFNLLHQQKVKQDKRRDFLIQNIDILKKSINSLSDAIILLDHNGTIEWNNRSSKSLLGIDSKDRGQLIVNLIRSPVYSRFFQEHQFNKTITIDSPVHANRRLLCKITEDAQKSNLVASFQDITLLKMLESSKAKFLNHLTQHARQSSNEITARLGDIKSEALLSHPKFQEDLHALESAIQRLNQFWQDFSTLTDIDLSNPTYSYDSINVKELVKKLVQKENSKAHPIIPSVNADIILLVNKRQIETMLSELIHNAKQFSPTGSNIIIHGYLSSEEGFVIAVKDRGYGIPDHLIHKVSSRFYSSNSAQNTGLGLTIVKEILRKHQGYLTIESKENIGSVFKCIFPAKLIDYKN